MDAAGIQARAVVKVVAISLAVIAVALLLAIVVLHVRTEIRWVFAVAVPGARHAAGGRSGGEPSDPGPTRCSRAGWRSCSSTSSCSASSSSWSSRWCRRSSASSRSSGRRRRATSTTSGSGRTKPGVPGPEPQVRHHPGPQPAGVDHPLEAGRRRGRGPERDREHPRAPAGRDHDPRPELLPAPRRPPAGRAPSVPDGSPTRPPALRRIATRIAGVVKSYVSVNLVLAVAAGVFTWLVLELLGVDLAVTMGVIVGFLDLVPLIGFTVGGLFVAIVAAFHDFPGALIAWLAFFLVYQQVQDRVHPAAPVQERGPGPPGGGDRRDPGRRPAGRHPRARCWRSRPPPPSGC